MAKEKLRDREFDESWKRVLDKFFWQFLDFYFPKIGEKVNKEKGYTFLDQELVKILRESKSKDRRLDKLAKVYLKDETEIWILIHVEVQSYEDKKFALRMYQYHYRIFEKYQKPIASLAVLTDDKEDFRPTKFQVEAFGEVFLHFQFKVSKILDFLGKEEELEKNSNPFSVVTLASLKTHELDDKKRFADKYTLTKMLYERGYDQETILALYDFLDGIMVLPEKLEEEYNEKIHEYEKEKKVAYINTAERIGSRKRAQKDVLQVLKVRFGEVPEEISEQISSIRDEEQLSSLLERAITIENMEEFQKLLST